MTIISDIIAADHLYATRHGTTNLPIRPAHQLAVLTCMDARIDPLAQLGLCPGDAHIIRNAGGRASDDALRSLVISTAILGVRTILVIQHSGCGMMQSDNRGFREQIGGIVGTDPGDCDFLPIADLSQSVRGDVATIREHPLVSHDITVAGFILDIDTGRLEPVS